MSDIPSPLPPKTIFKGESTGEERSPLVVLALQFFVIPLLIVLFCVALYFIFSWLTHERRDVGDYLAALRARSEAKRTEAAFGLLNYIQEAKRWQSLSDLNDQLRFDREKFLRDHPDFTPKLIEAFKEARGGDPKVAQYLSQVLALVGGPESADALLETLKEDGPAEQEIFVMIALGKMGEERAIAPIVERLGASDAGAKYAALFSLGFFDDPRAIGPLKQALNDPDPLAQWNAAFSLARLSGRSDRRHFEAAAVLKRLLDLEFVRRIAAGAENSAGGPILSQEQIELYRVRAVQLLGIFLDEQVRAELEQIAKSDPQLGVRQAAMDVLSGRGLAEANVVVGR